MENKDTSVHRTETVNTHTEGHNAKRIVGAIFGTIEVIIAFRFIFKLFGANPDNGFVKFLYGITGFYVNLFKGIFAEFSFGGSDSNAIFEPASLIGMIIVSLIALLVFKLMAPRNKNVDKTSYTSSNNPDVK